jgi:iron complex outermembrane receptor protein
MKFAVLLLMVLSSFHVWSSESDDIKVYTLGRIDIFDFDSGNNAVERGSSRISRKNFVERNLTDTSQAAALLPGVVMTASGARNERTVYVRGFDLRQVPLLIDGIPVYVPYDGYADLGRFISDDIAEIQVTKGFSSSLVGANALGGVINLVTRKPTKKFEADARIGTILNNKQRTNGSNLDLSLGGKHEKFYYIFSGQTVKNEEIRASDDFKGTNPIPHSRTSDRKLNFKVAFTPNQDAEYSLNYINQHGNKDVPTYAGPLAAIAKRYWTYPVWDKRSLYWISKNKFSDTTYLKTRAFYDVLKNTVDSYDDATYSTMTKASSFTSFYDDDSYGGNLEMGHQFEKMTLKGAFHGTRDHHRENNRGEPVRHFIDETFSIGLEDTFHFDTSYDLIAGISYDWRKSKRAEDYNTTTKVISNYAANDNSAFNPQVGLVYRLSEPLSFHANIAQKTRFPTMKDRYSYRLGRALPNPGLSPERSMVYEVGSQVKIQDKATFGFNLFYYDIRNTLQSVNLNVNTTQMQNIGKSSTDGGEFEFNYKITSIWDVSGNYTYLHKKNRTDKKLHFIDVPLHHAALSSAVEVIQNLRVIPGLELNSMRYSDTDGTQRVSGYYLANLVAEYRLLETVSFDFGINNIFDRFYELSSGYPEAGRNYFVNGRVTF